MEFKPVQALAVTTDGAARRRRDAFEDMVRIAAERVAAVRCEWVSAMNGNGGEKERAVKVLVVEDDELVREFAETMLKVLGFEPCMAGDGESALRLLAEHADIGIMLTDIGLPGVLDGPTLAEEARRRRPGLPVLFASGSVDSEGKAAKLAPGTAVLAKPYRKAELARRLGELLRNS